MTKLRQRLETWDGKSTDELRIIYIEFFDSKRLPAGLVNLIEDRTLQSGATWLLKHHLETGATIREADRDQIYACLKGLRQWEAQLHVLQSIPYMTISAISRPRVEAFVRESITSTNKFVRAWAYNGFYELARQYPTYQDEANQFFAMAMRDEPASVRARVRNILAKGF